MSTIWFIIVLLFSIILHELAHGYMAEYLGDPTPRLSGRLTFNPLAHLDFLGSIVVPFFLIITKAPFVFGWAKPVPFNPHSLRLKRWGPALVAFAGPLSNILLAILFSLFSLFFRDNIVLQTLFHSVIFLNVLLALFNLIPIPPLDGSHILFALLGKHALSFQEWYKKYSLIFFFLFLVYGWKYFSPLVYAVYRLITFS